MSSLAGQLNDKQLEAMKYTQGPLLVLAGAGSGKTSVITRKIAYLVKHCGIPSHRITAMTFTNKAAREMKERVTKLMTREEAKGLSVSTFHCLKLVRKLLLATALHKVFLQLVLMHKVKALLIQSLTTLLLQAVNKTAV